MRVRPPTASAAACLPGCCRAEPERPQTTSGHGCQEVVHGRRRAGIGRVDELDVSRELEQLHGHVRHAA
jgi:hypothetical protein